MSPGQPPRDVVDEEPLSRRSVGIRDTQVATTYEISRYVVSEIVMEGRIQSSSRHVLAIHRATDRYPYTNPFTITIAEDTVNSIAGAANGFRQESSRERRDAEASAFFTMILDVIRSLAFCITVPD